MLLLVLLPEVGVSLGGLLEPFSDVTGDVYWALAVITSSMIIAVE